MNAFIPIDSGNKGVVSNLVDHDWDKNILGITLTFCPLENVQSSLLCIAMLLKPVHTGSVHEFYYNFGDFLVAEIQAMIKIL